MFLPGTVYALVHRVRTLRGEMVGIARRNDQATRWIDGLSTVPRLLVWAGLSLIVVLTVALVEYLISGSFVGRRGIVPFVIVGTASGYVGSEYRNRKHSQG
jgi:hypothetical protein